MAAARKHSETLADFSKQLAFPKQSISDMSGQEINEWLLATKEIVRAKNREIDQLMDAKFSVTSYGRLKKKFRLCANRLTAVSEVIDDRIMEQKKQNSDLKDYQDLKQLCDEQIKKTKEATDKLLSDKDYREKQKRQTSEKNTRIATFMVALPSGLGALAGHYYPDNWEVYTAVTIGAGVVGTFLAFPQEKDDGDESLRQLVSESISEAVQNKLHKTIPVYVAVNIDRLSDEFPTENLPRRTPTQIVERCNNSKKPTP